MDACIVMHIKRIWYGYDSSFILDNMLYLLYQRKEVVWIRKKRPLHTQSKERRVSTSCKVTTGSGQKRKEDTMKTFADTARTLNVERRRFRSNPAQAGFYRNRRGLLQRTVRAPIAILNGHGQIPLGEGVLCYADQDPTEDGPEAELIRQHVWGNDQVGWLWAFVKGNTYRLAKISPMGAESLLQGFIGEGGEIVLKNVEKRT